MPITLSKNYVPDLDEVYRMNSLTNDLNSPANVMRQGANAHEILVPKMSMDGLGDYSRENGYSKGNVSLEWETKAFNYDRGRIFEVDAMDDEETIEQAFGQLAGEFIRTKVVPEGDAFTFAAICGKSGISKVATGTSLETGSAVMAAIAAGNDQMTNDEVPKEGRILYINPTQYGLIRDMDTTKSRTLIDSFEKVVEIPEGRFYTAIDMLDGTTSGEEAGHYVIADDGKKINFMIIHKKAIMKFDKHVAKDIIKPEENQHSDGYMQKYRKYGIVEVYDNKVKGVYLHHQA